MAALGEDRRRPRSVTHQLLQERIHLNAEVLVAGIAPALDGLRIWMNLGIIDPLL